MTSTAKGVSCFSCYNTTKHEINFATSSKVEMATKLLMAIPVRVIIFIKDNSGKFKIYFALVYSHNMNYGHNYCRRQNFNYLVFTCNLVYIIYRFFNLSFCKITWCEFFNRVWPFTYICVKTHAMYFFNLFLIIHKKLAYKIYCSSFVCWYGCLSSI